MKFSEYREKRKEEVKAFHMINGIWTLLAYLISYRLKEFLLLVIVALISWTVLVIIKPEIAVAAKKIIGGILK
jgi:dolichol kinase